MAKKNKLSDVETVFDALSSQLSEQFTRETRETQESYENVQDWEKVRQQLGLHGTDIVKNANDLMGDGDQSPIKNEAHAQLHRDIWSGGADVQYLFLRGGLSPFVMACIIGSVEGCKKMLDECSDQEAKEKLLETRFSLLRLSPIFFSAIGFATVGAIGGRRNDGTGNIEVMRLLLEHGARPDARDLCGKTIVHYCCGALCKPGTTVLLEQAALCIARAAALRLPKLVDARDRFGGVALQQSIMLQRPDLAEFLCAQHGADPTIKDHDGTDPLNMASFSPTIRAIFNAAQNKASYQQFKSVCLQCKASGVVTFRCGKCNLATYCSRDCQVAHWKAGHKKECCAGGDGTAPEIVVTASKMYISKAGGGSGRWDGKPPQGVAEDEAFDLKVQVGPTIEMPFLLYDKTRTLETTIEGSANCHQFRELFAVVHKFAPCAGRKAYFRAKVNSEGELRIATSPVFVRKW